MEKMDKIGVPILHWRRIMLISFARAQKVNETYSEEGIKYCLKFSSGFLEKPREHIRGNNFVEFN